MNRPRLPVGFQRRIQLALVLTAVIPLGVGVIVAREMLDAALATDPTPEVVKVLQDGVRAHQRLFKVRRALDELRADTLAADRTLLGDRAAATRRLKTACEADPDLLRLQVDGPGRPRLTVPCPARPGAPAMREAVLLRTLPGGAALHLTFGMPETAYAGLQRTGLTARLYAHRLASEGSRVEGYWIAFGVILGLAVLVAGFLGLRLARETTRRIEVLAGATRRVSGGDLAVEVPEGGDDELADLAAAFNTMVREIRDRGARIVYLEKISSWQDIARRLAHEIKNPLTPIQLAVQQLASRYRGDDPRFQGLLDDVVAIVREEVETLRRLVSEFSEFARLPEVAAEPTDLGAWLEGFVASHPDLAGAAELDLDKPAMPVWAPVDRTLMRRVMTNLVENAVQAAAGADLAPRIHLAVTQVRHTVILTVADEGPGIPEELVDRVFEPYFTTKETGTGLGLPICKKIVLQHGGELTVERPPEGGTRFTLELPAATASASPEALPSAAGTG